MSFDLSLTPAHHDLIERTHAFAEEVVRPVAARYDREQAFPWEVVEAAAQEGFYNPLFYRDPDRRLGLALSAMAQAATPEQLLRWRRSASAIRAVRLVNGGIEETGPESAFRSRMGTSRPSRSR